MADHDNDVMWRCDDPNCDLKIPHGHLNVGNFIKVAERLYLAGKSERGEKVTPEEWAAVGING